MEERLAESCLDRGNLEEDGLSKRLTLLTPARTAHGIGTKARMGQWCPPIFLAMTALQLWTHLACDGCWNRIQQPWDVIELFSTESHVSLAVSSAGGRATRRYDDGLDNSLRTLDAREQLFKDVESGKPRLIVAYLPDWTPVVSELMLVRTRNSPQVSIPHLDAVAPDHVKTPSGLRNSGWSGCRHPSKGRHDFGGRLRRQSWLVD